MSNTDFIKKLLFRAGHRGTKEMDLVLGGFFKNNIKNLNEIDLLEFEKLLEFSDKALTDYFVMNKNNNELDEINITKRINRFFKNGI